MASWNNNTSRPNWQGNGATNKSRILTPSTINADEINANYISTGYLQANSISSANGSIAFLSNLVLNTGVIALGISPTFLTAEAGVLYVNGDAVAFPSSFSTIADWSQFKAVANVDMSRSSIYNVQSISTNILSTGILTAGSISTINLASSNIGANNLSSINIGFDTLNGRAGIIGTLGGTNIVYSNAILSNLTSLTMNTRQLNTSNVLASNSITSFAISSVIVSTGYITADVGFFNSTFNSTIFSYKGIFQSTATGFLIVNNISSGNISASNISATLISNVDQITLSGNRPNVPWDSAILYAPGDIIFVSPYSYVANFSNLDVNPQSNIENWAAGNYLLGEAAFVAGVGTYSCLASGFYGSPPNTYPDDWIIRGATNNPNSLWSITNTIANPFGGTIIGNSNSLIRVGNVSSIYMNASTIVAGNLVANVLETNNLIANSFQTNNISSGTANIDFLYTSNIYNSNALQTNSLDVISDSQLNTLTTSGTINADGALNTNNTLNLGGGMAMNSDIVGSSENITIPIPPFVIPQYFNNLDNINEANVASLTVIGGATGNNFFPPYRNNSIVNIGLTEFSPGIVTIYGVNAELTSAFTVYGITSLNGDTTVNGLNTVNGLTDLNGDLTVIGLTTITGDTDITGLTSITGNTDINGACEITGFTNLLGGLSVEAGIAVVGAMSFQGGDFIIGSSPGGGVVNNFNLYNYYNGTDIQNLTVNGSGDFRQSVNIDNNLTVGGIIFGTVVSGSESVSTIGVSTLRAYNISTIFLNAGQIKAKDGIFDAVSTNRISTTTINAINTATNFLNVQSIYNQFYSEPVAFPDNNVDLVNHDIINVKDLTASSISTINISTGSISTTNISADFLNFKEATGQLLNLKGEGGGSAGLGFFRDIEGIQEFDTGVAINNVDGFTMFSLSTINVRADKEVNISSLTHINLNTPNGYTYAQYASTGSLYTSTINFGLGTGQGIQLQAPPEEGVALLFYRNIDGVQEIDTAFGLDNTNNFRLTSLSSITIQAVNNIILGTSEEMALVAQSNITIATPDLIVPFNANISSINTNQISTATVFADNLIAFNGIGANNIFGNNINTLNLSTGLIQSGELDVIVTNELAIGAGNLIVLSQTGTTIQDNQSINIIAGTQLNLTSLGSDINIQALTGGDATVSADVLNLNGNQANINGYFGINLNTTDGYVFAKYLSTGSIYTSTINTSTIAVNNFVGNSISTNLISTGVLASGSIFTNSYNGSNAGANLNMNGNLIPTSGGITKDLGNDGAFRWNRLFVSTVSAITTFTSNITGPGFAVVTQNLYPQSAGSQLGFFGGGGTNSGGFYGQVNVRSTITQLIVPDIVGAFSNNIRVQGNLSTQNVFVSTINRKQYPTRSTIGGPFFPSSFTLDGTTATTPQLLISSINFYAGPGNYDISQRMAFIKLTGGASVDAHGSILVASTNTLLVPDSNAGYGQVPQVNDVGHSTFTTLYTSINIGTNSFQRQYKYLDTTGGNYTGSLYLEGPVITYIPSQGINPE